MTDAHQPGNMVTGQKHNRLNGQCPDHQRCSLEPFACSDLCWRLEPELIELARLAGARLGVPVRPGRTIKARSGRNT